MGFKQCQVCRKGVYTKTVLCTDYISKETFELRTCSVCKSGETTGIVNAQSTKYYGEQYYNAASGKFRPRFERFFRFNHKQNAKRLYRDHPSSRILEVGCGRAYILRELRDLGSEVSCLESTGAVDWIINNDEIKIETCSETEQWPFASNMFDLVIFWHVFEHLPDPRKSLEQATRCLSPKGVICISVPNISSLQARIRMSTWFHLDVPRHIFHFSVAGLSSLLEEHEYQITSIGPGDRMQNLFGWLQSIANLLTPRDHNSFYRLLQGKKPLGSVNKYALVLQLLSMPVWVPLGILGFLIEELSGNHGSVTVFARKTTRKNPAKLFIQPPLIDDN